MENAGDRNKAEQKLEHGVGAVFVRRYGVNFTTSRTPEDIMYLVKKDVAAFSPEVLADFEKAEGHPWGMKVGDEYDITILGPWNGTVRVSEADTTSFTFVTLEGHPEAGEITFSVRPYEKVANGLRFTILSKARSRDGLVQLGYDGLGIGKVLQKSAWTTFCKEVVKQAEGEMIGKVQVKTVELESNRESE